MTKLDYLEHEPHPVEGPVVVWVPGMEIDYEALAVYIRSWPDKLISFFADRLADDDMQPTVREFFEYASVADRDGPGFEEWLAS